METTTPQNNTQNPFSNLGTGGILVTIFAGSFFAAQITSDATVLILYGWHAFFNQHLRVADWKHSILSNGVHLSWFGTLLIGPTVIPIIVAIVFIAEFLAGRLRAFLAPRPRWMTAFARLLGAGLLFSFWYLLVSPPDGFPLIHPIPLSALIAGVVLIWNTPARVWRSASSS